MTLALIYEADKFSKKGTFIIHELTEAYEGAKISSKTKASSPPSLQKKSVYEKAHEKATYQPVVYQKLYDIFGNITLDK